VRRHSSATLLIDPNTDYSASGQPATPTPRRRLGPYRFLDEALVPLDANWMTTSTRR